MKTMGHVNVPRLKINIEKVRRITRFEEHKYTFNAGLRVSGDLKPHAGEDLC